MLQIAYSVAAQSAASQLTLTKMWEFDVAIVQCTLVSGPSQAVPWHQVDYLGREGGTAGDGHEPPPFRKPTGRLCNVQECWSSEARFGDESVKNCPGDLCVLQAMLAEWTNKPTAIAAGGVRPKGGE